MGCDLSKSAAVHPAANAKGRPTLVQPRSATAADLRAASTAASSGARYNTAGPAGDALLELVAKACRATGGTITATATAANPSASSSSSANRSDQHIEELVAALTREDIDRHIDFVSGDGRTCLSIASQHGHAGMVRALLQRGANPNIQLHHGDTAAHVAAAHGHMVVLFTLIDSGAEVGARNKHGHTVVDRAKHALAEAQGVHVDEAALCSKHHQQWQAALRGIFALNWQEEARQALATVSCTAPSPAATAPTTAAAVGSVNAGSPSSTRGYANAAADAGERAQGGLAGPRLAQQQQQQPDDQAGITARQPGHQRGARPDDNADARERRAADACVNRDSVEATAGLGSREPNDLRASQGTSTDPSRLCASPQPPSEGVEDLSSQFSQGVEVQTSMTGATTPAVTRVTAMTPSGERGEDGAAGATNSGGRARGRARTRGGESSRSTGGGSAASSGVIRPRQILVSTPNSDSSSGSTERAVFGEGALDELFGLCNALLGASAPGTFIKQDSGFVTEDMASEDGDAEHSARTLPTGAARLQVPEPRTSSGTSGRSSGAHVPVQRHAADTERPAAARNHHSDGRADSSAAPGRQQSHQQRSEYGNTVRRALRAMSHYNRLLMEFMPWQITADSAAALSCADWELLQQLSQAHGSRLVRAVASWCCALRAIHQHCGTVIPSRRSGVPGVPLSSSNGADNANSSVTLHFPIAKKEGQAPDTEAAKRAAIEKLEHTWCALTLYEAVTEQHPNHANGWNRNNNNNNNNKTSSSTNQAISESSRA